MPLRHDFLALIDHQIAMCDRYGARLDLGIEADVAAVTNYAADVVILATGAHEESVAFPEGGRGLTLTEALSQPWELGERVAFYDTVGTGAALSVAEHLARLGKRVTILTPLGAVGRNVTRYSMPAASQRLRRLGVRIGPLRRIRAADTGRLIVENTATGSTEAVDDFDSVVAAGPARSRDDLCLALAATGLDVMSVGDCVAPRSALEAVFEGHGAGRAI
jgi:hypothetical protein